MTKNMDIKKFWEACGLKWFWDHNPECFCGAVDDDSGRSWHYRSPNGNWHLATRFWYEQISPDLNNLFKYAQPTVVAKYGRAKWEEILLIWFKEMMLGKDPAVALYEALYPVTVGKEIYEGDINGERDKGNTRSFRQRGYCNY